MGGTKPANPPAQAPLPLAEEASPPPGASLGPGLTTLLKGQRPGQGPAETPPPGEVSSAGRIPRSLPWTLLAADVLLITLAVWIVARGAGRAHLTEILLVAAALGLGAWLGCCAFLLRR
jgi:hypothetical protein